MSDFNFHDAPIKGEGQMVTGYGTVTEPKIKTTWLEMRIPEELEDACEKAVIKVLRDNGYEKNGITMEGFKTQ
jgi:hypothetical protein